MDRGSKETLDGAIEAAQKSDTVVYFLLFKGEEQFSDHHSFSYPGMELLHEFRRKELCVAKEMEPNRSRIGCHYLRDDF